MEKKLTREQKVTLATQALLQRMKREGLTGEMFLPAKEPRMTKPKSKLTPEQRQNTQTYLWLKRLTQIRKEKG